MPVLRRNLATAVALGLLSACGPLVVLPSEGGSQAHGEWSTPGHEPVTSTTAGESVADSGGSMGSGSTSTGATETSWASGSTSEGVCEFPSCGGAYYECNDGMDNDGDRLFDLDDPECLYICDADESAFPSNLPGDNFDCKLDCAFDGNSGMGDDLCQWDLRCDPENPGRFMGCEYRADSSNCVVAPELPPHCISYCEPLTPNGCDCFGCCELAFGDNDPIFVYLGEWGHCSLDEPEYCPPCTPQIEACGNPCEPEACEVCVGQTAPPPGCEAPNCGGQAACTDHVDCECDEYCQHGCCRPAPNG